jgi:hypothetical protein
VNAGVFCRIGKKKGRSLFFSFKNIGQGKIASLPEGALAGLQQGRRSNFFIPKTLRPK